VCRQSKVVFAGDHVSLLEKAGLDTFADIFHARGLIVDRNRQREVLRLPELEDGSVPFLKKFLCSKPSQARDLARREWDNIQRFVYLALPGPECAAHGFNLQEGAFLLFLAPGSVLDMTGFLEHAPGEARARLLSRLPVTLAEMHDSGIGMPDLMARHVLVRPDGGFYFIDLANLRFHKVSVRKAMCELAGLSATLEARLLSMVERLRFLRTYLRVRKGAAGGERIASCWERIKRLEKKARRRRRFPEAFKLEEVRGGEGRIYLNREYKQALQALELKDFRDFARPAGGMLLRDLGERRNYRFDGPGQTFFLKIHRESGKERGTSRGRKEWESHLLMKRVGIPTPVPVAWGEGRGGSFFMSLACPGRTGEELAPTWDGLPWETRRRLVEELAFLVARLHGYGLYHRDLYLSHLVVEDDGIRLIDLQRLVERPWFERHRRIKDLAALLYSSLETPLDRTERLRFMKIYLGGGKPGQVARRMIRRIARKADRIAKHGLKKGARNP
jgi:heptose I phosphotransferase